MDYSKLSVTQLKQKIEELSLKSKLPRKGSGSKGNILKSDYVDFLDQYYPEITKKGKNYNKYTVGELKNEINRRKIASPYGKLYKRDLIKILKEDDGEKLKFTQPVGKEFLEKMNPDIIRMTLEKSNIDDALNFCRTSKDMMKVCTEAFWQTMAKNKLNITKKGQFKSWYNLVKSMKYGPEDITSIYKGYLFGIYTKLEAENMINQLINDEKLTHEGMDAIYIIKSRLEDELEEKYDRRAYGMGYSDPGQNPGYVLEEMLGDDYWVYYDVNFDIYDYDPLDISTNPSGLLVAEPGSELINSVKNDFKEEKESWLRDSSYDYWSENESGEEY